MGAQIKFALEYFCLQYFKSYLVNLILWVITRNASLFKVTGLITRYEMRIQHVLVESGFYRCNNVNGRNNDRMLINPECLYVLLILSGTKAALFGEQCTSSSECTDVNTQCVKYRACAVGTCQCVTGYGNANGNACDKILRHFGEQCDNDHICLDSNQECDSTTGLCACAEWNSYNSLAQQCITVTRYVLTETCGGWWQLQCLISEAEGGLCDNTCQCQNGYTMATSESYIQCRAPQYGEYCSSSVACEVSFDTATVSDDTSSTAPRCLLNMCLCPPSHELKVVMGYNLCLNKVDADYVLKEDGENCTHFNECESSLCVKCVGASTGLCMPDDDTSIDDDDGVRLAPDVVLLGLSALVIVLLNVFL